MNKIGYLIVFLYFAFNSHAQNRNNIWYFGKPAGLDFSTNPPLKISSPQYSHESSSIICDNQGNLLFSTNGDTVWNRNHVIMQNGTGLLSGRGSASQGVLILPKPCDANIYYIFTVPEEERITELDSSSYYSIVDMREDDGLGAITVKNQFLHKPVSEKLTAILQANGNDYWVIEEELGTGNLLAFRLTDIGVNTIPVVSFINNDPISGRGYLRFSHDGNLICNTYELLNYLSLFHFNKNTGEASVFANIPGYYYGAEFSPDNTKLYVSESFQTIWQYDVTLPTPEEILNAGIEISPPGEYTRGALKLGPDKRIYSSGMGNSLAVIDQPNEAGSACNFIENFIVYNDNVVKTGLPNLVDAFPLCDPGCAPSFSNVSDTIFSGQPYILPNGEVVSLPGVYENIITNINGCDSVIKITLVAASPSVNCLTLRNAFTPNGDGINDLWVLYQFPCFLQLEVNIYNRYGSLVFHSDNYENNWNGYYKNKPLPDGTYYYTLKIKLSDWRIRFVKGDVTILR